MNNNLFLHLLLPTDTFYNNRNDKISNNQYRLILFSELIKYLVKIDQKFEDFILLCEEIKDNNILIIDFENRILSFRIYPIETSHANVLVNTVQKEIKNNRFFCGYQTFDKISFYGLIKERKIYNFFNSENYVKENFSKDLIVVSTKERTIRNFISQNPVYYCLNLSEIIDQKKILINNKLLQLKNLFDNYLETNEIRRIKC